MRGGSRNEPTDRPEDTSEIPYTPVEPPAVAPHDAFDPDVDDRASIRLEWPPPGWAERSLRAKRRRSLIEWFVVLAVALTLAVAVRVVAVQAYWIPSASMENTLLIGDRVLVSKLSYKLHTVHRGDVVVFTRPEGVKNDEVKDLIKRVVALPGESVQGSKGRIYIDDQPLAEPYLKEVDSVDDFGPVSVPAGSVFVMGDNRRNSTDSRVFGPIPESSIVGRAFVRFWPIGRFGSL